MLVEILCQETSHFLEIAEAIRSLDLTILKGSTRGYDSIVVAALIETKEFVEEEEVVAKPRGTRGGHGPQAAFKSREDHSKQIELEEARKAGLAPTAVFVHARHATKWSHANGTH
ncbi:hypothetical protein PIB30_002944 [Stylosanthes scabra]|uniref:Uncharacterized protein n=1 Tax=Stylosanthes scabra TaxID=79078 RepID=A0ABU6V1Z3_9FABA|nr:hypothetical protein [Stylosanthes scabra]